MTTPPHRARPSRLRPAAAGSLVALAAPLGALAQQQSPGLGIGECPTPDGSEVEVGFSGLVVDKESEIPLPGAIVRLEYEDAEGEPSLKDATATTDGEGRYRLCGLTAFRTAKVRASYLLRRGDEETVDLSRPEDVRLEVDLGDPAFIIFTIADADTGSPIEGATVELSPIPARAVTDSLGRATFREIPPGDYELSIRHLAYAERSEPISLEDDQLSELRVELRTQAIALEPLEVQVTGRDPYLLDNGFYERKLSIGEDGYFGTHEEIESYTMIRTLFQFKRELSIRFARNRFVLLNGRPMNRLGFSSVGELSELPYSRIRGVEAYSCSDAPDELMIRIRADIPIGDCNLVAIWTR